MQECFNLLTQPKWPCTRYDPEKYLSNLFAEEADDPNHQKNINGIPIRFGYKNNIIVAEKAQEDAVRYLQSS